MTSPKKTPAAPEPEREDTFDMVGGVEYNIRQQKKAADDEALSRAMGPNPVVAAAKDKIAGAVRKQADDAALSLAMGPNPVVAAAKDKIDGAVRKQALEDAEVTMSELEDTYAADRAAAEEGVKAFDTEAAFEEDFKITHGGSFDPKSKMDKGKMETIREMRAKYPNATPAQLAVMIYRLPKKK